MAQVNRSVKMETTTTGVALIAASTPFWATGIADVAAILLPVLGIAWLLLQMAHKIKHWNSK